MVAGLDMCCAYCCCVFLLGWPHVLACTHRYTHTDKHINPLSFTHRHTNTTHIHSHIETRTHRHTYTHTYKQRGDFQLENMKVYLTLRVLPQSFICGFRPWLCQMISMGFTTERNGAHSHNETLSVHNAQIWKEQKLENLKLKILPGLPHHLPRGPAGCGSLQLGVGGSLLSGETCNCFNWGLIWSTLW